MREWERQMQADRRAVVQQARKLVDELDAYLVAARLQRRALSQPVIYKTKDDALVAPRLKYRTQQNARIWR